MWVTLIMVEMVEIPVKSEQEILKMVYEDGVERTIKYPRLQLQKIVREASIIQHDHTPNN